jgi:hypothetical protein
VVYHQENGLLIQEFFVFYFKNHRIAGQYSFTVTNESGCVSAPTAILI